jgi:hypothetical protein
VRREALGAVAAVGLLALGAGCSADRIERGVFYSSKGYQVTLPASGWRRDPGPEADLALARGSPPGGMLADATCEASVRGRPLRLLARHATFGMASRETVEQAEITVGGRPALRTVLRGRAAGALLQVESVVVKDEQCVYDFLYVAPLEHFEQGRGEFRALVGSFGRTAP